MKKFIIIYYKYCPNFLRYKLLLDWWGLHYECLECNDKNTLESLSNKLLNNYYSNYVINNFYGTIILYENEIIENIIGLIACASKKKIIKITQLNILLTKESWIETQFLYEFFWLSVGNNIVNIFHKSSLISEKNQVGNNILIQKLQLLNYLLTENPWINGSYFSFSDASLFFIMKAINEKNPNILNKYYHLNQWFDKMLSHKDLLFFLKNEYLLNFN